MMRPSGERGPIESTSRDLMARFDMAKDDRDRPPGVRAYLENLRPQILKLQRELRLQSDEDIAGLDRRGDVDMNEVDKLVGLIEAFKKVWKENRLSPTQEREVASVEILRTAGAAWKEFVAIVDGIQESPTERIDLSMPVILATARAGEPRLAWEMYGVATKGGQHGSMLTGKMEAPVLIAIWQGFLRVGETPPFEAYAIRDALVDPNRWSRDSLPPKLFVALKLNAVLALIEGSKFKDALVVACSTAGHLDRMRALMLLRKASPSPEVDGAIQSVVTEIQHQPVADRYASWMILGETEKADEIFLWHPTDEGVRRQVAERFVRGGDAEAAFGILEETSDRNDRVGVVAVLLRTFLEMGDAENARRVLSDAEGELINIESGVGADIVVGFVRLGDFETAEQIADLLAESPETRNAQRLAAALGRIVIAFEERGIATDRLLRSLERLMKREHADDRPAYAAAFYEARAAVPLRAFKRAARALEPRLSSDPSDREAWETKARDILKDRRDLADLLTYAAPIDWI